MGSQGNIGIGSENPSRPLTVRAAVASQELISLEDPNGKVKWHINQNLGGNNPGLNFVETGVADGRLFLKAGGNVGINNVNPQRSLHVEGSEVHSGGTIAPASPSPTGMHPTMEPLWKMVQTARDGSGMQRGRQRVYGRRETNWLWIRDGNVMISHGRRREHKAGDNVGLKLIIRGLGA